MKAICSGGLVAKKIIQQKFIERAKEIHGNKYDYSKSNYINSRTNIEIICPIHGIFWQNPGMHIRRKYGCPKCAKNYKLSSKEFVEKAVSVHGNKYDYSLVEYVNSLKKVKIICHKHGVFKQIASGHLSGNGCPFCFGTPKSNKKEFIEKAKKVHGDRYDYSLVEYKTNKKYVKIICPEHGVFNQRPDNHIQGFTCPKCKMSKGESKVNSFLTENGFKFEYNKFFEDCKDKRYLTFDFYLQKLNLIIEYDGEQHFKEKSWSTGEFEIIKKHEKMKENYLKEKGIDLIRIPYWEYKNIDKILKERLYG